MNVLQVIPTASPSHGGPREAVFGLARELYKRGVKVEVVTTGFGNQKINGEIPIHEFPNRFRRIFPSNFFYSPEIKKWFETNLERFNIVHVHGLFAYPNNQACRNAARKGIPYILRPCGMLAPWALKRSLFKKKIWVSLFEQKNLNDANAVHCTSNQELIDVGNFGMTSDCFVIPPGVNQLNELTRGPNKKLVQKFYEIRNRFKILFLSRIHPKKGFDVLVPALKALSKRKKDFVFVLSGEGEPIHERELEYLLIRHGMSNQTIKTGFVEKADKKFILSNSDLFVLPSYQENFGIAVAEAMAEGLPVLVSNKVDLHKEVRINNAGIVVPLKVEEISSAIEKLLDDEDLRKKMGENGKRLVREKYNWEVITPKVIRLYEQTLSGGKRQRVL